jgi:hypothetical protein
LGRVWLHAKVKTQIKQLAIYYSCFLDRGFLPNLCFYYLKRSRCFWDRQLKMDRHEEKNTSHQFNTSASEPVLAARVLPRVPCCCAFVMLIVCVYCVGFGGPALGMVSREERMVLHEHEKGGGVVLVGLRGAGLFS